MCRSHSPSHIGQLTLSGQAVGTVGHLVHGGAVAWALGGSCPHAASSHAGAHVREWLEAGVSCGRRNSAVETPENTGAGVGKVTWEDTSDWT